MEKEKQFYLIVEGQKAALKAVKEIVNCKSVYVAIGAISVLKAQAEALTEHILENSPNKLEALFAMIASDELYSESVTTEIIGVVQKAEGEDND